MSAHFLVAAHVFLELLPDLVWVIPLMTLRISLKWIHEVPLARRSPNWRRIVMAFVAAGAFGIWHVDPVGFVSDRLCEDVQCFYA